MGYYVSYTTGNWSAAGTWRTITNATDFGTNFTTGTQTLANTTYSSRTFTAPNLTESCVGCLVGFRRATFADTAGTIAITLQNDVGAGFVDTLATKTINISTIAALGVNNLGFSSATEQFVVAFYFPVPHLFTTTTADKHRFKIVVASLTTSGATVQMVNATNIVAGAITDATGVPTSTESVYVCGNDASTVVTVTVDNTSAIAGSHLTTVSANDNIRSANSLSISPKGVVKFSRAADSTLTVFNSVSAHCFGKLDMGTVADPIPSTYTAKMVGDMTRTSATTYRISANTYGYISAVGSPRTGSKANYRSTISTITAGDGTAATPLILDAAADWSVNDYIVVCPSSDAAGNYGETEYKYIKTKNSSTSYVLANTAGGAESGLTNARVYSDIPVLNVSRNVQFNWVQSGASNVSYTINNRNTETTLAAVNAASEGALFYLSWVEIQNTATNDFNSSTGTVFNAVEYITFTHPRNRALIPTAGSISAATAYSKTITELVVYNQVGSEHVGGASANGIDLTTIFGLTVNGLFIIDTDNFRLDIGKGLVVTDLNIFGSQQANSSGFAVGIDSEGSIIKDAEIHCARYGLFTSATGSSSGVSSGGWYDSNFGTKGRFRDSANSVLMGNFYKGYFYNCHFDATFAIFLSTAFTTANAAGASVVFQNQNGTTNNNFINVLNGASTGGITACGSGLSDTTTRTSGALSARIEPGANGVGFTTLSMRFPVRVGQALGVFGFSKKNASMVGTICQAQLFLPGSATPDATTTLTDSSASWSLWALNADYAGSVPSFARVDIIVYPVTASAKYLYIADINNGNNVLTDLTAWGEPGLSPLMTAELGNPREVWDVVNSGFAAGTMGQLAADTRIAADDATIFALSR